MQLLNCIGKVLKKCSVKKDGTKDRKSTFKRPKRKRRSENKRKSLRKRMKILIRSGTNRNEIGEFNKKITN